MKIPFALAFSIALGAAGCEFQTLNSASQDEALYGTEDTFTYDPTDPAAARFAAARAILRNKCLSCHTWASASTEEQWKADGRVVAGSLGGSMAYTKLRGAGYGGNMPNSGALTTAEITTIRDWIANMQ